MDLFWKKKIYFPENSGLTLLPIVFYRVLFLRTQPIQVGETNIVYSESIHQGRQPLAPGERELALGEVEVQSTEGKRGRKELRGSTTQNRQIFQLCLK